jgi:hypothetical protein
MVGVTAEKADRKEGPINNAALAYNLRRQIAIEPKGKT